MKTLTARLALIALVFPFSTITADQPAPIVAPKKSVVITAPLALGEFFDKLTILMIKRERISDPAKLKNVNTEFELLNALYENEIPHSPTLSLLIDKLMEVNSALWDLEDATREKERVKTFDMEFRQMAQRILENNDTRFTIKRAINEYLNSPLVEEKSYKKNLARSLNMGAEAETITVSHHSIPLITIPISLADLLDRISILEIKLNEIKNPEKLAHVHNEYETLMALYKTALTPTEELNKLYKQLLDANKKMWDIQDGIRPKVLAGELDDQFVEYARGVYYSNDARCRVKREINMLFDSALVDEKAYASY